MTVGGVAVLCIVVVQKRIETRHGYYYNVVTDTTLSVTKKKMLKFTIDKN